jgi:hypothetical protein
MKGDKLLTIAKLGSTKDTRRSRGTTIRSEGGYAVRIGGGTIGRRPAK